MSYGEQFLPVNDQECIRRVPIAYRAEGFSPGAPSVNTTYATKGIHAAYIRCLGEPEKSRTRVIIVVGSSSSDENIPGAERVKLQRRMESPGGSLVPATGVVPASGCTGFQGSWSTNYGIVTVSVNGNRASGSYYAGGQSYIAGTVNGNVLDGEWNNPGRSDGTKRGPFRFVLNADGTRITGYWREADGTGGTEWTGTCAPK